MKHLTLNCVIYLKDIVKMKAVMDQQSTGEFSDTFSVENNEKKAIGEENDDEDISIGEEDSVYNEDDEEYEDEEDYDDNDVMSSLTMNG